MRKFTNGKALGAYAGLVATPYSSGGSEREQGISKAGNRRLRTAAVELAWLWLRYYGSRSSGKGQTAAFNAASSGSTPWVA